MARFTPDECKCRCSGAVQYQVRGRAFGEYGVDVVAITREHNGKQVEIAAVWPHPSGHMVVSTPDDISLTEDTLISHVIPVMHNYLQLVKQAKEEHDRKD